MSQNTTVAMPPQLKLEPPGRQERRSFPRSPPCAFLQRSVLATRLPASTGNSHTMQLPRCCPGRTSASAVILPLRFPRQAFYHLLPHYLLCDTSNDDETTMKRDSDAAFGEPDPLLDKYRKVLKRAEDIVDEAMPEQLFMQQMSTLDHESTKYVDITILCAVRLAGEMSEANVTAIARRYWNDNSERLERNALNRYRKKAHSTPAVEIVRSWLESTAPTKKTPVLPQEIVILDDDSDAASAADQLAEMKKESKATAQQSTKREPAPTQSVHVRNNKRKNLEPTAKVPTKKESTSTQPVPVCNNEHMTPLSLSTTATARAPMHLQATACSPCPRESGKPVCRNSQGTTFSTKTDPRRTAWSVH